MMWCLHNTSWVASGIAVIPSSRNAMMIDIIEMSFIPMYKVVGSFLFFKPYC
jgi:hypothetical protein